MDKLRKIEINVETNDCTFYFDNSSEPFSPVEFGIHTITRKYLTRIAYEVADYNTEVEVNGG